jgi:hypothetical protein
MLTAVEYSVDVMGLLRLPTHELITGGFGVSRAATSVFETTPPSRDLSFLQY